MKSTKIDAKIQRTISKLVQEKPVIYEIIKQIQKAGGRALLVGGAVRDLLLSKPVKDLDIEVHGISLKKLENILDTFGRASLVGKSFGVLRLHGLDVDWSLPRTDKEGRKPQVKIDPNMAIKDAFGRRDLTINALGIDLITNELIDPFGGKQDLKQKILRAPIAKRFPEDPLRLFRVMQFIGRFEMEPDEQLNELCKEMKVGSVSRERIEGEMSKLLLKSEKPSLGLRWLHRIGRLNELFPELAATVGVPQNPSWHPEGDVFEHTMQAIDAAARVTYDDPEKKLLLMYAALCHDLGKVTTTKKIDGVWRSLGHAQAGVPIAKQLLKRVTRNKDLICGVQKLVQYHMEPALFVDGKAKLSAYKRLANKLAPDIHLKLLADLARADKQGRGINGPLTQSIKEIDTFEKRAQSAAVHEKKEEPILQGRDLLPFVQPGPHMGVLLDRAYQIQLDEGVTNKDELKQRVLDRLSNNSFPKQNHSGKLSAHRKNSMKKRAKL